MLVQVGDLGHVPGVLEQDDVSGIQADGPVAGVFVKDVLDQIDDGRVIAMGPGTQHAGMGHLHIVDDDQSSGLRGQLLGEVLRLIQQLHGTRGQLGQLLIGRLHVAVKEQNVSGHPRHDARRQRHQLLGQCGPAAAGTAGE